MIKKILFLSVVLFHCTPKNNGRGVGETAAGGACDRTSDCVPGFECNDDICVAIDPEPASFRGRVCTTTSDCNNEEGLVCRSLSGSDNPDDRVCTHEGNALNEGCAFHHECQDDLFCSASSKTCVSWNQSTEDCHDLGVCPPGEICAIGSKECELPFQCGVSTSETVGSLGVCTTVPFYTGPDCQRSDQERGAYRVYFEVPKTGLTDEIEFYRLPFPNDIRLRNGILDMGGHPAPADDVLGINLREAYLDLMQTDVKGFAVNAPVFFQFSDKIDYRTLCLSQGSIYPTDAGSAAEDTFCDPSDDASLYLVDLQTSVKIPVELSVGRKKGQYICQNWVGVAPIAGYPLQEGRTYAVVVTQQISNAYTSDLPIRDRDFTTMLGSTAPNNAERPELTAAYTQMAPFRTWLATLSTAEANAIVSAAVFTTASVTTVGEKIYSAVNTIATATPPTFNADAVTCAGTATVSPCDIDDGTSLPDATDQATVTAFANKRGCSDGLDASNGAENYYEVQGTYSAPVFQSGTRPYRAEGGGFTYDSNGVPIRNTDHPSEKICYVLTVPKNIPQPVSGWPVVIFGHGTGGLSGGNYRTALAKGGITGAVQESIAHTLAAAGFVVLGFDGIMHGPRQTNDYEPKTAATTTITWAEDSGRLFFNILNPKASRDNILQGAADLFYITRLLNNAAHGLNVTLDMDGTPDNDDTSAVTFNSSNIYYIGHSQGTVVASPYLLYEPKLKAAILSAAGAELALSLLNKKLVDQKNPDDASKQLAVKDLVSAVFVDRALQRIHPMMGNLAHLFAATDAIVYADHYFENPVITRGAIPQLYFSGTGDTLTPLITQTALFTAAEIPSVASGQTVSNNVHGKTAGVVTLDPPTGKSGHFVMFDNVNSDSILQDFLNSVNSGSPQIIIP